MLYEDIHLAKRDVLLASCVKLSVQLLQSPLKLKNEKMAQEGQQDMILT